jgi:transposase
MVRVSFEEQAATLNRKDVAALLAAHHQLNTSLAELSSRNEELTRQLEWFKRQLFGSKSERRIAELDGRQPFLGEGLQDAPPPVESTITVAEHRRRRGVSESEEETDEGSLRFDPSVPVEEIRIPSEKPAEGEYELVAEKTTYRLAQRPGSYVVLKYVREVIKRREDGTLACPAAPPSVLGKSFADVSLLAGLLLDKFRFHLPLYRQHQRLEAAGIRLARSTLTGLVLRTGDLLKPIYDAQLASVRKSDVLAMDETPIKAGRTGPGKMRTAYFWPVYGDRHEVVFPFSLSRAGGTVCEVLGEYRGVLLTDGYQAYERYVAQINDLVHALCWSHTRRWFVKAEEAEPALTGQALEFIRRLYDEEARLKRKGLDGAMHLEHRSLRCKPIVDEFFAWLRRVVEERLLLPSNPFTEAAGYALGREAGLRVFLEYPNVPMDTNHLERQIRPIAVGRKNWLFCWTEVGAECVGIVQSLVATCRLQGVDPYTYLVDVLQRLDSHPAAEVAQLTPRLWKEQFAANPLRSDLDRPRGNADS